MKLLDVNVADIHANPNQPRQAFEANALAELADSIREHGIIQPITVRTAAVGFEIIAGERRWRAAQLADLTVVPCVVLDGVDDDQSFILATVENCARKDMKPIEEAKAYAAIVAMGKSVEEVATLVGKACFAITWRLELLNLAPEFQTLDLPLNVGRLMSRVSIEGQRQVMRRYVGGEFKTTQECERFCNAVITRESSPAMFADSQLDAFGADDLRRARADVNRKTLTASWTKALTIAQAFGAFDTMSDQEIADALNGNIDKHLAEARELEAQARRTRIVLERAEALQKVVA